MGNNKAKTKKTKAEGCEVISISRHKNWEGYIQTCLGKERKSKTQ